VREIIVFLERIRPAAVLAHLPQARILALESDETIKILFSG